MEFIKIDLGKELEEASSRIDALYYEIFQRHIALMAPQRRAWAPSIDIYETQDEIIVLAEMAGVEKDDIRIVFERNHMRIFGHRKVPMRDSKIRFHQMEIEFGPFERLIRLDIPLDIDSAKAVYEEGFLRVILPKKKPIEKQVEVKEE